MRRKRRGYALWRRQAPCYARYIHGLKLYNVRLQTLFHAMRLAARRVERR
jgi:hypothetical protein